MDRRERRGRSGRRGVEVDTPGLPVVADFDEDGGDEAEDGRFVGKEGATRVRRRISLLRPSKRLDVRSFLRLPTGSVNTVSPSGMLRSIHAVRSGADSRGFVTASPMRRSASMRSTASKTARMSRV